jgi:hypothetical protein
MTHVFLNARQSSLAAFAALRGIRVMLSVIYGLLLPPDDVSMVHSREKVSKPIIGPSLG